VPFLFVSEGQNPERQRDGKSCIVGCPTIKAHDASPGATSRLPLPRLVISALRGWRGFGSADSTAIAALQES